MSNFWLEKDQQESNLNLEKFAQEANKAFQDCEITIDLSQLPTEFTLTVPSEIILDTSNTPSVITLDAFTTSNISTYPSPSEHYKNTELVFGDPWIDSESTPMTDLENAWEKWAQLEQPNEEFVASSQKLIRELRGLADTVLESCVSNLALYELDYEDIKEECVLYACDKAHQTQNLSKKTAIQHFEIIMESWVEFQIRGIANELYPQIT